ETVSAHEHHAALLRLLGAYCEWVIGHDLQHASGKRIAAGHHHALHQIAFREDTDQLTSAEYGHRANVAFHHGLRQFEDCLLQVSAVSVLTSDQIVDNRHLCASRGIVGGQLTPTRLLSPRSI